MLHWAPTNKVAPIPLGADHELLVQREGEVGPVARQRTPPRVCFVSPEAGVRGRK